MTNTVENQMTDTVPSEREALSILATLAHEVFMGAISDPELQDKARLALKRAGLTTLESIAALAPPTSSAVEPVSWFRVENGIRVYYETNCWPDLMPLYSQPHPPAQAAPVGFNNCVNESENFPCRDWCRRSECRSDRVTPTQPAAQPAGVRLLTEADLPYHPDHCWVWTDLEKRAILEWANNITVKP